MAKEFILNVLMQLLQTQNKNKHQLLCAFLVQGCSEKLQHEIKIDLLMEPFLVHHKNSNSASTF